MAPPYRDHRLAFRLSMAGGGEPRVLLGEISIRGWLPGTIEAVETVEMPAGLDPGAYDLAIGVVDPSTNAPDVRLAIAGRNAAGWYPVSQIELAGTARSEPMLTSVDVFTSGADGYHTFRIPAIEIAADGTLLAFAEARKHTSEDPGFGKQDIDLVLKRSTDGGKTWSKMKMHRGPRRGVVGGEPGDGAGRASAAGCGCSTSARSRSGTPTLPGRGPMTFQTLARMERR